MFIYGMALPDIQADHAMLTGMARTGRPKAELMLSDNERASLERWARRAQSSQAIAQRANIILACAEGCSNQETAALLRCHQATAGKWRRRFTERRLDGLHDEPRPGRLPTITDEQVEQVVVDTLETTPKDATHWSRTSMAKRSGLSRSTVGRIWKAFHLKPHLADTFKLSSDPLFAEKVCDVAGLYLKPAASRWPCSANAAYGAGELLDQLEKAGADIGCMVQPPPGQGGRSARVDVAWPSARSPVTGPARAWPAVWRRSRWALVGPVAAPGPRPAGWFLVSASVRHPQPVVAGGGRRGGRG